MIIVWGPAGDAPIAAVHDALVGRGLDVMHIDTPELETIEHDVELGIRPTGWLSLSDRRIDLDTVDGLYLRPATATSARAREASAMLMAVSASLPAVVVNRPWAGRSNWSKPNQLRLIAAAGIAVPDTIVTTDRDVAHRFLGRHGRVVYKSISGIRSIVAIVEGDGDRLEDVGHGPVQFQQWVPGVDVRVHVIGDRWIATRIESAEAPDYRYAAFDGGSLHMTATEIPVDLGRRLVELTHDMGLAVSGIDLRVDDGSWWCFEVNPSPGFTFYEDHTGQPITDAVADLLCSTSDGIPGTPAP